MVVLLLGVLVALGFGSADFLGGRASRHAPTLTVLLVGQAIGLAAAFAMTLVVSGVVRPGDLAAGGGAGLCGVAGLGLLYEGLATGRMGVVASITAVVAAVVPVGWGLLNGERPSVVTGVGVVFAVGAAGLVASEPTAEGASGRVARAVGLAVTAGAMFGTSIVLFATTRDESGLWPVLTARVAGVAVLVLVIATVGVWRGVAWPTGRVRTMALAAGVLDVATTMLFVGIVRDGLTVVVAPVAALGPAFTVMWAWVVLHERVSRHQVAGIAVALTGLTLIAAG